MIQPSADGPDLYDVIDDDTQEPLLTAVPKAYLPSLYAQVSGDPGAAQGKLADSRLSGFAGPPPTAEQVGEFASFKPGPPEAPFRAPSPPPEPAPPPMPPPAAHAAQPNARSFDALAAVPASAGNGAPPPLDLAGPGDTSGAPGAPGTSGASAGRQTPTEAMMQQALLGAARGSPGMRVPEKDVRTTAQMQLGQLPLSEGAQAQMQAAEAAQQGAAAQSGEHAATLAALKGAQYAQQRARAEEDIAALRTRLNEEASHVQERMSVLDQRMADLQSAKGDATGERHYWEDRGALGSALASAALVIGAYTSTITGGPNKIQEQVNTEIEREIKRQRDAIDDAKSGIAAESNRLAEMRQNFLSPEAAEQALRALMMQQAATEIAEVGSYFEGADSQAKAQAIVADLQVQAAQRRAAAELAEQDHVVQNFRHQEAGVAGGAPGGLAGIVAAGKALGLKPQDALRAALEGRLPGMGGVDFSEPAQAKAKLAYAQDERSRRVTLPSGEQAWAPTEKQAESARSVIVAGNRLKQNFAKQLDYIKQSGKVLKRELVGDYKTLAQRNTLLFKQLEDLGAITSADQEMVSPLVGAEGIDVMTLDDANVAKLKGSMAHVNARIEDKLMQLYRDPGTETPFYSPVKTEARQ